MSGNKDINIDIPDDILGSQEENNDIEIDETSEDDYGYFEDDSDELAEKIEEALASANDKYIRLMAEYDNYRKRTSKEKIEIYGDAVIKCISEIIPVIDNFERAIDTECSDENYRNGIEMIFSQFRNILEKLGVKEIEALGNPFDPNLHNAIKQVQNDDVESDIICEVFQKGYMLNDKVIRHAMVSVNA